MKKIFLLLLAAFVFRLFLSPFLTYHLDQNTFIAWGNILKDVGYKNFYASTWSDYLPGYLYILNVLAYLERLDLISKVMLYKLPAMLADITTGYFIYLIIRKRFSERKSLAAASIFLFNPAVIINSTFWGQVDSFTSLFSVVAIYFLNINIFLSAIFLAFGALVKPQIAMALPIVLALMVSNKWNKRQVFTFFSVVGFVFVAGFLPFSNQYNNLQFILSRISITLNQYEFGSVNAFNFWGLLGFWKADNIGFFNQKKIGDFIALAFSVFSFLKVKKQSEKKYLYLSLLFLANFLFMTRMHERHMLAVFAPLAIVVVQQSIFIPLYIGLSLTYLANMAYGYLYISPDKSFIMSQWFVKVAITVNLALFAYMLFVTIKNKSLKIDFWRFVKKNREIKIKDKLSKSASRKILLAILFFSLVVRLVNLSHPKKDYFDEIYHAFTARTLVDGDPGVWDWSTTSPEGFAYEWSHPPLNKEIMAFTMRVLSVDPFYWRLPGALMGVGIILLTFEISYLLTKSRDISILASLLVSLDGLTFTMSRIGTADVYVVFFILLSFYFYLKDKYLFSSLALGAAAATKWSTIWFLPLLVVAHLSLKRNVFDKRILLFFAVPVVIYLLSYSPMFLAGYNLEHFWGMQKQMWWYHSTLKATHPYSSRWWTWPFMYRPVYLYQLDNNDGRLGNIYAMGNPGVFWFGIVSVVVSFYLLLKKQAPKTIAVSLFAYLIFFVPWVLSPRIMFVYHYLPSIPFMAILSAYVLKKFNWLVLPVVSICLVLFIYFYPQWTGLAIPASISKSYYWFGSWR